LALVAPSIEGADAALESNLKRSMDPDTVEHDFAILLTAAPPGSIPASVWRTSHVIYL